MMLMTLAHDGTTSVVSFNGYDADGRAWVTFGEDTPGGFSPCYACVLVEPDRLTLMRRRDVRCERQ